MTASLPAESPCLSCGACCASFRVDFAVQELMSEGGSVPDGLAEAWGGCTARMRGTDHAQPRCAALQGRVGMAVSCGIYEWRPTPCREFGGATMFGRGDPACNRARRRHGLAPLPE